jgi:hypothetical protein
MQNGNEEYHFQIEMALSSLQTKSGISTFLAGAIYIIIPIVIQYPGVFFASQYYIMLLFVGAMFLTFSSISYFETAAVVESVKLTLEDIKPHLRKIQNLRRFGDRLFAIGIIFFMAANVWMISGFGFILCIIAALIGLIFLYMLIMKR